MPSAYISHGGGPCFFMDPPPKAPNAWKKMEAYLRGRRAGEVPALLQAELSRLGAPADLIAVEASETDAVRAAFAWAREGDLLVLLSHAARARTLAFLDRLGAAGWRPGEALPPS